MQESTAPKVPQIRFKGFKAEWEEKTLGEIVLFLDELREPLKAGSRKPGQYPYYGASGIIDYVEDYLFNERLILLSEDGANIIDRNYPICFIADGKYWVNNHAHVLRAASGFSDLFIRDSLERLNFEQYNTGTAQPKLNQEVCRNIPLRITKAEEQTKIGEYFRALDTLIRLHQRKHDKLVTLKKAMLQKMFPQPGATMPEIRFKGFEGDWVEKKLGGLCEEFNSGNFISASEIAGTGHYPVYGGNGLRGFTEKFNHDGQYALIGRQGALCGNMNLFSGKAFFTEHAISVRADKDNDTVFLFYLFGKLDLGQYSGQSAQPGLAVNKLQKLGTLICKKNEQIQIGTYFRSLDTLISQHATQLQKLQQIKSACLEKMFV